METVEKVIIRVDFHWAWCIHLKTMSKDNKFFHNEINLWLFVQIKYYTKIKLTLYSKTLKPSHSSACHLGEQPILWHKESTLPRNRRSRQLHTDLALSLVPSGACLQNSKLFCHLCHLIQVNDKQSTWTHYHHITHIHFIPSKNQIKYVTLKGCFSDDISLFKKYRYKAFAITSL